MQVFKTLRNRTERFTTHKATIFTLPHNTMSFTNGCTPKRDFRHGADYLLVFAKTEISTAY